MSSHPYSIEINEPEECDERDPFDNSDEEMEIRREREQDEAEDVVTRDRTIIARLIRNEFDRMGDGIEAHDGKVELIRVAERLMFIEMAQDMMNDLKVGSI